MELTVIIGIIGVMGVLAAYALLASGHWRAHEARYQWLNVVGTAGILISLIGQWNVAAFVANISWIAIGIYSLVRIYRKRGQV